MNFILIDALNGSKTLYSEEYNENYHNLNGPEIESEHIFINLGLKSFQGKVLNILEVGYGTGLNALMTFIKNEKMKNKIYYHGIDVLPVNEETFNLLSYHKQFGINKEVCQKFCVDWNIPMNIENEFILYKEIIDFQDFTPTINYDLIYFDAFSPNVQPEMWSFENLSKIIKNINEGGIFVTYCSKGMVKQSLRDLGMEVKRFSGPVGKRHVIRAIKK